MTKSRTSIIILLLIIILLIITNPNEDHFISWIIEQENASNQVEEILDEVVGRTMLQATTSRDSYLIFSVFSVQEADKEILYIGFLRKIFFRIS